MPDSRFKLISAAHLFLLKGDEILLLRRYNTGYEDGNYSVVAGHLDGGESVKQAMVREAREEAGVTVKPENLDIVHVMHRITDQERIDWFFIARSWQGELQNCEPDKCDDLSWFSLDALPENIVPYIRTAIYNWRNNISFSEFGWEKVDDKAKAGVTS